MIRREIDMHKKSFRNRMGICYGGDVSPPRVLLLRDEYRNAVSARGIRMHQYD